MQLGYQVLNLGTMRLCTSFLFFYLVRDLGLNKQFSLTHIKYTAKQVLSYCSINSLLFWCGLSR
jgi:hypothetical protein